MGTSDSTDDLAECLRQAIRDSGRSATNLAKATGVPQPTISRFLAGGGMELGTATHLTRELGIVFARKKKKPANK